MNASQTMAGRQFIAGRRIASGEATLLSLRAVDGEATGHRFYPASCEEAAQAAEAAQQAFAVYSQTTPQQRARFLNAIADELDALGEPFLLSPDRRPRCAGAATGRTGAHQRPVADVCWRDPARRYLRRPY